MCGILAAISPQRIIDKSLMESMRDTMDHRGPDGSGLWMSPNGRVCLGHRRLAVVDTSSAGIQPMESQDRRFVLVFNGEIYNYRELRVGLEAVGYSFRSASDTEVLLNALAHWGTEAIEKLNGMFAFALWDGHRQELLIARDRFGEKPIFTTKTQSGLFLVASEMKALLRHPEVSSRPNSAAIESFVKGNWSESDSQTFFDGIDRFEQNKWARYSSEGGLIGSGPFWFPQHLSAIDASSLTSVKEEFTRLLRESIELRRTADVPVGSSLSGGLDSSIISAIVAGARGNGDQAQHTFSAVFPSDPTISEEREVDILARHLGLPSHRVSPEPAGLEVDSTMLHWHQEEPFESASIYLQWAVARLAAQHQVTVLLDGQGADELLGGYQSYLGPFQRDLLRSGRWAEAFHQTGALRKRLRELSSHFDEPHRRFSATPGLTSFQLLRDIIRTSLGLDHSSKAGDAGEARTAMNHSLFHHGLPGLLRYADRNSMAFSREVRLPFLDIRLVDFCLSLPTDVFFKNGWQKWLLRDSAAGLIPDEIRWRADKVGYAAPLDQWLRGPLKKWAEARLQSSLVRELAGDSWEGIQRLWDLHQHGIGNHSWELWRWISLFEWWTLSDSGAWRRGSP